MAWKRIILFLFIFSVSAEAKEFRISKITDLDAILFCHGPPHGPSSDRPNLRALEETKPSRPKANKLDRRSPKSTDAGSTDDLESKVNEIRERN